MSRQKLPRSGSGAGWGGGSTSLRAGLAASTVTMSASHFTPRSMHPDGCIRRPHLDLGPEASIGIGRIRRSSGRLSGQIGGPPLAVTAIVDRGVMATATELFEARHFPSVVALITDALDADPTCVPLLILRARAHIALRRDL